ncbi:hypothetical protein CSA08_05090 [Candidatus Gracilibacteria bacterium]|nr:MAG: hypothetical protein CSA08_05090 [Candidatus Gracilibacteria bacterium]
MLDERTLPEQLKEYIEDYVKARNKELKNINTLNGMNFFNNLISLNLLSLKKRGVLGVRKKLD